MAANLWISVWYLCGLFPGQPMSGIGTVPFLLIFAGGFFFVGFGSLHAMYQMHRMNEQAATAEVTDPIESLSA